MPPISPARARGTYAQLVYWNRLKKLTLAQRQAIRASYAPLGSSTPRSKRPTIRALALQYNVSHYLIWRVVNSTEPNSPDLELSPLSA